MFSDADPSEAASLERYEAPVFPKIKEKKNRSSDSRKSAPPNKKLRFDDSVDDKGVRAQDPVVTLGATSTPVEVVFLSSKQDNQKYFLQKIRKQFFKSLESI